MTDPPSDPWENRRRNDPVLRAVINVLCNNTQVSYYSVDWRVFLFGARWPVEQERLARGLRQNPDDCCGSQSIPFDEGGGGYLERFGAHLGHTAGPLAATIRDALKAAYDRECSAGRGTPALTFDQLLTAAHWTPEIFAAFDEELHRQQHAVEQAAIAERGGQLDMFAA
jgi:hypothetical protein